MQKASQSVFVDLCCLAEFRQHLHLALLEALGDNGLVARTHHLANYVDEAEEVRVWHDGERWTLICRSSRTGCPTDLEEPLEFDNLEQKGYFGLLALIGYLNVVEEPRSHALRACEGAELAKGAGWKHVGTGDDEVVDLAGGQPAERLDVSAGAGPTTL